MKSIQSVERALRIMEAIKSSKTKELGITEIGRNLDLHKSTVFNIVSTLEANRYVQKNSANGKYRLGLKLFELGCCAIDSIDIRECAISFLQRLVDKFSETAHLVVLDNDEALYIEKVEGTMNVRIPSQVGKRNPLHCTGVGKVLMAFKYSDEEAVSLIEKKGLPKYTDHTICEPESLKNELKKVREQGYAIDNQEIEMGLRCVAAPIWDYTGNVIATVSLSGPASRIDDNNLDMYIAEVKEVARAISRALGGE